MRMIMSTTLTLCIFYSSQLMAHPHVSESDAITHHGIFHTVGEGGLSLLFAILVGFILIKVVKYFNETDSSNK